MIFLYTFFSMMNDHLIIGINQEKFSWNTPAETQNIK